MGCSGYSLNHQKGPQDHICGCRMVGQNGHCLGKVCDGMPAESRMYYDRRGIENNSNKSAEDVPGSTNTGNGGGVCSTDGSIPPTETTSEKPRNRAQSGLSESR